MRHRVSDPFGERDRRLYPNSNSPSQPNPVLSSAQANTVPTAVQRTLTVEYFEGTPMHPSGKSMLRLKGKWLGKIFAPHTRVKVHIERGRIVIETADS